MKLERVHSIYFIGIGGIGMSALAKYFLREGKKVAGYDRSHSAVTRELETLGVSVDYADKDTFRFSDVDMIVYTPAVAPGSQVRVQADYSRIPQYKRAEVLGEITREVKTLAVAGTHGKTTTTAVLSRMVREICGGVVAFIGGKSLDYNSNFVYDNEAEFTVTEADEYDRSFLQLSPDAAIVTGMEADHLDVYGSEAELRNAFSDFCGKVSRFVLVHEEAAPKFNPECSRYTYGFSDEVDFKIENRRIENERYYFDLKGKEGVIKDLNCALPGKHNTENAAAAAALCWLLFPGSEEKIKSGLAAFKGVERRFEKAAECEGRIYIDDYAHHPKEIDAVVGAARELYPRRTLTVVFQPHLYSRTSDFMEDFAVSLSKPDRVFLLDIYPAREKPVHGVTSAVLIEKINALKPNTARPAGRNQLCDELKKINPELLLTLGAGDIDQLREPIKKEVFT